MDRGVRVIGDGVLVERLHRAGVGAVCRVRGDRPDGHVAPPLLDEVRRERPRCRRHAERGRAGRAVHARGLRWRRAVGVEDGDVPEHAEVLHPGRAFDERAEIEPVVAGSLRRLDRELEPRDLAWADIRRGLDRDAVVSGPSGGRRPERAVAAERAGLILPGLWAPGPEVGDLAEHSRDPSPRPGVVVRDGRGRALAGTEGRIAALAVPLGVEARDARWQAGRRRDPGAGAAGAGRGGGA